MGSFLADRQERHGKHSLLVPIDLYELALDESGKMKGVEITLSRPCSLTPQRHDIIGSTNT